MTETLKIKGRFGFRTCRRPRTLGTILDVRRIPGGPQVVIEITCWTVNGYRTYRRFRTGRRELWMVFSKFDN